MWHGACVVALPVVEHAERAARLGLCARRVGGLREREELLQEAERLLAVLHALIGLRESVCGGALRLQVLGRFRERQMLLVVPHRLGEVLRVAHGLMSLPKVVLRLLLLGGVAASARRVETLGARVERAVQAILEMAAQWAWWLTRGLWQLFGAAWSALGSLPMLLSVLSIAGFVLHARRHSRRIGSQRHELQARAEAEERKRRAVEEQLLTLQRQLREEPAATGGSVLVCVQVKVALGSERWGGAAMQSGEDLASSQALDMNATDNMMRSMECSAFD